jgi:hypothetical protein
MTIHPETRYQGGILGTAHVTSVGYGVVHYRLVRTGGALGGAASMVLGQFQREFPTRVYERPAVPTCAKGCGYSNDYAEPGFTCRKCLLWTKPVEDEVKAEPVPALRVGARFLWTPAGTTTSSVVRLDTDNGDGTWIVTYTRGVNIHISRDPAKLIQDALDDGTLVPMPDPPKAVPYHFSSHVVPWSVP